MNYLNDTFEDILTIATSQLAEWEPRLSAECFAALSAKCHEEWAKADRNNPYGIFRGGEMSCFVSNWFPA